MLSMDEKCGKPHWSSRSCPTYFPCGRHPGFMRSARRQTDCLYCTRSRSLDAQCWVRMPSSCRPTRVTSLTFVVLKERHRSYECLLHEGTMQHIEQNLNDYFAPFTWPTGTAHLSGKGAATDSLATVKGLLTPSSQTAGRRKCRGAKPSMLWRGQCQYQRDKGGQEAENCRDARKYARRNSCQSGFVSCESGLKNFVGQTLAKGEASEYQKNDHQSAPLHEYPNLDAEHSQTSDPLVPQTPEQPFRHGKTEAWKKKLRIHSKRHRTRSRRCADVRQPRDREWARQRSWRWNTIRSRNLVRAFDGTSCDLVPSVSP